MEFLVPPKRLSRDACAHMFSWSVSLVRGDKAWFLVPLRIGRSSTETLRGIMQLTVLAAELTFRFWPEELSLQEFV